MSTEIIFKCETCGKEMKVPYKELKNTTTVKGFGKGIYFGRYPDDYYFCEDHISDALDFVVDKFYYLFYNPAIIKDYMNNRNVYLKNVYNCLKDTLDHLQKGDICGVSEMREEHQD